MLALFLGPLGGGGGGGLMLSPCPSVCISPLPPFFQINICIYDIMRKAELCHLCSRSSVNISKRKDNSERLLSKLKCKTKPKKGLSF